MIAHPKVNGSFLSIVVYAGTMNAKTADAVIRGRDAGLWRGHFFPAADGISRARNHSAAEFLKTSCEYHEFIDNDILFEPAHVKALRRHGQRDITCGIYPKKTEKVQCVYNSLPEGNPPPDEKGLMEIAYGGTGFMRIHRNVYLAMIEKCPELEYTCDFDGSTKWDFFGMGVKFDPIRGHKRYLTEDWMFCNRARELGFRVWADTTIDLGHIGLAVYPLAPELKRLELERELKLLRAELLELQPVKP